jgi:CHAT domain-containing protein/tetratricopeptide (TPR) repeat protein
MIRHGSVGRILSLCALAAEPALCQQSTSLTPQSTVKEVVRAGERRSYRIDVPDGRAIEIAILDQQGTPGVVLVRAPNGTISVQMDLAQRIPAARRALISAGAWLLEIVPANRGPVGFVYEVRTGPLVEGSAADSVQASAERLLGEGEEAYRKSEAGRLETSLEKYEASLALWVKLRNRAREIDALCHVGLVRYELSRYADARAAYQHALDLARMENDRSGESEALNGLARVAIDAGQTKEAFGLAADSVKMRRALGDWRGEANSLLCLAAATMRLGNTSEAITETDESLAAARHAGDRLGEADALNLRGLFEHQLAKFPEASEHYSQALAIAREEGDRGRASRTLTNLGVVHQSSGELRAALRCFEEAMPVRKQLGDMDGFANSLYNASLVWLDVGEYQKALDGFHGALDIYRRLKIPNGEAYALQGLASLYLWTGESDKAAECLKQALARRRAMSDQRGEALVFTLLGDAQMRQGDSSAAIQSYRQSLAINKAGGYQRGEASTLVLLAAALIRRNDISEALETSNQALELSRKIGDRMTEANALLWLGRSLTRAGETARAEESFTQALSFYRAAGDTALEADALAGLARIDNDQGKLAEASDRILAALDLAESIRANIGNSDTRMRMASLHRAYYDLAIDVQMRLENTAKAFEISERAHARGLVDLLTEGRIDVRQGADEGLLSRERAAREMLDAKHERFQRLLASNHSAAQAAAARKELDELVDRFQAIEGEIRAQSPAFAMLTHAPPISLAGTQLLLPAAGTVLVEFWLGERRSYAWVVSKTGCRGWQLPQQSVLEGLARQAYEAANARNARKEESVDDKSARLDAEEARFNRIMRDLSVKLLEPLDAHLAERMYIVADGALEYLPFAAMPLPRSTQFLVEKHELSMLPSASVLSALRSEAAGRATAEKTAAVFADPVFRSDDPRVAHRSPAAETQPALLRAADEAGIAGLARLSFSRQEADAISGMAPPRSVWKAIDFDASRAQVLKPGLAHYRIVHFATHALLNSRHPELSGVVLSLVNSNGQPQDGFLTLNEIYNLKLHADLVVLSGCQTALGKEIRSEGLVGLTRGFMYAGSPRVIASLWSIRDRSTAEFMRRFYEATLVHHLTPAAALRQTQLSMMHDAQWSDPYYWGAFVAQGER